ncbi:hypothetical protein [Geodermatophilus normandii]|uniref:Small secreted domain DUF320 n=1 Tax=Geodermatophilus normandii TaxID=1137989 RepID=A0A6P0GM56_9ACTN|nr:hypothetical protein [Geodermatophilus normandii]NEM06646.1 hypothetical protein [Geodermatophilus normandii]NEM08370.1 hypothetical protein [Geodermatophilus normandii]
MQIRRTAVTLASVAALGIGGVALAAPASAQPIVTGGLVNVNIEDVNVQIPIGVAANVCGVTVAVIAEVQPAPFDCEAAVRQDLPVRFR